MPNGIEIERKYIIFMPDIESVSAFRGYTRSEITQTYLSAKDGIARRVRKREYADGSVVYTETIKSRIDNISVNEDEREISAAEYDAMLSEIKEGTHPLNKTRHTFEYKGHTIEIDVYPNWTRFCIMEIELESRDEDAEIPSFIKILYEVTGDKRYSNAKMAEAFPPEPEI